MSEKVKYTHSFNKQFANEFKNFPQNQKDAITSFIFTFQSHGLADFSNYKGKIAPSWTGLDPNDPDYIYARENDLWHYHIGIPRYEQRHGKYKTSDMILHFQWFNKGNHINIVDVYDHYDSEGNFYLPASEYLDT